MEEPTKKEQKDVNKEKGVYYVSDQKKNAEENTDEQKVRYNLENASPYNKERDVIKESLVPILILLACVALPILLMGLCLSGF